MNVKLSLVGNSGPIDITSDGSGTVETGKVQSTDGILAPNHISAASPAGGGFGGPLD